VGFVRPTDTALAVVPRALYTVCLTQGLSPEWLQRHWRIRPGSYAHVDSFVPYAECLALWDAMQAGIPECPVGVEVGKLAGSSDFGIVGLASAQARTLGEALATFSRLQHVIDPTFALRVEAKPTHVAVYVEADKRLLIRQHPVEAVLVSVQRTAERLTGTTLLSRRLEFAHSPQGTAACYEHVFGCQAERTDRYRLCWEPGVLDLKVVYARPELLSYLTREAEILARERVDPPLTTTESVQRWIEAHRGSSAELSEFCSRAQARASTQPTSLMREAARNLGRSVRTLQRQLAEEGETFRGLVEAVLCERARLLLEVESRTVAEVAAALGYCEQRSFHRAFRRWTGRTPSEYRTAHTSAATRR
jgi:AraC-like DNA-binding protein